MLHLSDSEVHQQHLHVLLKSSCIKLALAGGTVWHLWPLLHVSDKAALLLVEADCWFETAVITYVKMHYNKLRNVAAGFAGWNKVNATNKIACWLTQGAAFTEELKMHEQSKHTGEAALSVDPDGVNLLFTSCPRLVSLPVPGRFHARHA